MRNHPFDVLAVALITALFSACGDGPEREDDSVAEVMAESCECDVQGYLDVATNGGTFACEEASWEIEPPGVSMRLCLDYDGMLTFTLPGPATFIGHDLNEEDDEPVVDWDERYDHPVWFDFEADYGDASSSATGVNVFVTQGAATVTVRNRP